ncbi:MAG TPA: hypothetical protein VF416_11835 [Marmoricola sp.]
MRREALRPAAVDTTSRTDQSTIPEFYPMDWLPNGVRLTAYSGDAAVVL